MTQVVVDASVLVAALADAGPDGQWAATEIAGMDLAAPALLAFEAANIIRRHEAAKIIGSVEASQAHAALVALAVEQWPYDLLAARAWELRRNLTSYDASCVALAERLRVPLLTLDRRIKKVRGVRCEVRVP